MEENIFDAIENKKTAVTTADNIFEAQDAIAPQEEAPSQDTAVEIAEPTQSEVAEAAPEAQESYNQKNIRALREKAERAAYVERENQRLAAELEQYKQARYQNKEEVHDDIALDDDQETEDPRIKKLERKIQKMETDQLENHLKATYPDYDKVVNSENLARLKESKPYLAQTLFSNPDLYSKAITAYEMIKGAGIYQEPTYTHEREVIARNQSKPRSMSSIAPQQSDSPLNKVNAFANGLTPDLQKQLYKEMTEAMNNR